MKYIDINWEIPFYNFALEEYLIKEAPEDSYMFFYIHKPSIIVGRFQNTIEEINKAFVDEHDIIVARRLSGGGAVYHDEGNLNFSFVQPADKEDVNNFEKFTRPVIEALNKLDITAEMYGRNDIVVDGKKISGNAQHYAKGRILSHGTLLFDSDMSNLGKALKTRDVKIKSKGVKSVKSRVANIKDYLDYDMSVYDLKNYILKHISESLGVEEYELSPEELKAIEIRADDKFSKWEWNWGESPDFELEAVDKFSCGLINVKMNVQKGKIEKCKIYGDFFTWRDISELESFLIGQTFEENHLGKVLHEVGLQDFFRELSPEVFARFLVQGSARG